MKYEQILSFVNTCRCIVSQIVRFIFLGIYNLHSTKLKSRVNLYRKARGKSTVVEREVWYIWSLNIYYYSFKIFPRFWLAKSTCLIHHNQLLMTKFGRNLTLTRKWRQKCSIFAGSGTVNREDLGTRLSCFGFEFEKMADISLVSRVITRRKNS